MVHNGEIISCFRAQKGIFRLSFFFFAFLSDQVATGRRDACEAFLFVVCRNSAERKSICPFFWFSPPGLCFFVSSACETCFSLQVVRR